MNRTIGGIPIIGWVAALGLGIGAFYWIKKRGTAASSPGTAAKPGQPQSFTQAQEVQDFQVFSALTGAQQASDLNFLSEVAGLFSGGSSTGTSGGSSGGAGGGGSAVPSPPATGTTPPAPVPASGTPAPPATGTAPPATTPGYGLVQTAQGQMVWLGTTGPGGATGSDYQVGGGAPVYFGNAGALAQGGTTQQNVDVYTPVGYSGLVSGQPG